MASTSAKKPNAPPETHQSALFGMRKVARIECDQERLAKINPKLLITRQTKAEHARLPFARTLEQHERINTKYNGKNTQPLD